MGFGGGSSYIALLILFEVPHTTAPALALICNIIVVVWGTRHALKKKNVSLKDILPFILLSVPLSYIGGNISLEKELYQLLLAIALFTVSLKMIFFKKKQCTENERWTISGLPFYPALIIGGLIGFISGLVGIGGGIFLTPILYLLNWGNPKKIAATASVFILVNSLAGLAGHIQKTDGMENIIYHLPLVIGVFFGGQLGAWFCHVHLVYRKMEILTSLLIFAVSTRLFFNVLKL